MEEPVLLGHLTVRGGCTSVGDRYPGGMAENSDAQSEGSAGSTAFVATLPTELRILPFIILLPSAVAILVEPVWWVIALIVIILAVLVWAAIAVRISVSIDEGAVNISAPFYRRSIPVAGITEVSLNRESAADYGMTLWPVAGVASSPVGVRIGLGGTLGPRITTTTGETYKVFLGTPAEAESCVAALAEAVAAS